jgi:alpha-ribazole phosphatase
MQLYLIRHPEPAKARGKCYGRQDLSVGIRSLKRAAAEIRRRVPHRVLQAAEIYSSPLTRCLSLARELAAPREPKIAERLVEMSFGSWEGLRWDKIPPKELHAWADDLWGYKPGGAESPAMVAQRFSAWLTERQNSRLETVLAVTHAGVIRVALACNGQLDHARWASAAIEFGSVYRIEVAGDRTQSAAAMFKA